jgi:DNA-binding response OmpR family regulator
MPSLVVIDDDPSIRQFLDALLTIEGYAVYTAADGISGMGAINLHRPDCVLLDAMMPGADGYQVLHTLRHDPAHAALPVVMISAASDSDSRDRALRGGAQRFLRKPFEMEQLLDDLALLCAAVPVHC